MTGVSAAGVGPTRSHIEKAQVSDEQREKNAPCKPRIQVWPRVSWPGQVQNKTEHGDLAVEGARCPRAANGGSTVGIRFWTVWPRWPLAGATCVRRRNVSERDGCRVRSSPGLLPGQPVC